MNPGNVTLFATNVLSYELLSGFGGLERARGGQGRRPATRGHRGTDGCRAGQVSAPPRHRQPDPLRERNPVRPVGGAPVSPGTRSPGPSVGCSAPSPTPSWRNCMPATSGAISSTRRHCSRRRKHDEHRPNRTRRHPDDGDSARRVAPRPGPDPHRAHRVDPACQLPAASRSPIT